MRKHEFWYLKLVVFFPSEFMFEIQENVTQKMKSGLSKEFIQEVILILNLYILSKIQKELLGKEKGKIEKVFSIKKVFFFISRIFFKPSEY